MRTTIDIPTPLFKRAKAAAAEQGMTLRSLIVRALEMRLEQRPEKAPYKFEWEGVSLGPPLPEDEFWEAMRDQDRRWLKEYVKEQEERRRKKR